jgi:hypothetical protein
MQMIGDTLQHVERSGCFLLRQEIDLQLEMIPPRGGTVDRVLPNENAGG